MCTESTVIFGCFFFLLRLMTVEAIVFFFAVAIAQRAVHSFTSQKKIVPYETGINIFVPQRKIINNVQSPDIKVVEIV